MALERTFSIIKPDATKRNLTGAVNAVIEKAGLRIVAQKRLRMTRAARLARVLRVRSDRLGVTPEAAAVDGEVAVVHLVDVDVELLLRDDRRLGARLLAFALLEQLLVRIAFVAADGHYAERHHGLLSAD